MATLVETSDEEPVLAVARFLAELELKPDQQSTLVEMPSIVQYCGKAEALLAQAHYAELVKHLVAPGKVVFAKGSDKDIEGTFAVLISLAQKAANADEEGAIANEIAVMLTAGSDKAPLRLRLLFQLYNVVKQPKLKYSLFMKALTLASASKSLELVTPLFKKLEGLVKEWGISNEEQRALYLAATNALKDSKQTKDKESWHYLIKYLATFGSDNQQALATAKDAAVRAAVEFIKAPDMFQCDLLDLAAVRALEKDPKMGPIYSLLNIFLTGKLGAYLTWAEKNKAVLTQYGLSHDENMNKMRLMSLASLGAESSSGEVPYSVVQDTLQVSEDDLEEWIVRAIGQKLLDAKIDQLRQVIVVNRCTQRVFGTEQWQELRQKLAAWRSNIDSVSRIVQQARVSGGIPQGLQAGA